MALQYVTQPASEPVIRAEAKAHLRIDSDDEDQLIDRLIAAARRHVEAVTWRQLISAQLRMKLDRFPCGLRAIYVPRPPLISVDSISYTDSAGDPQTLTVNTDYLVDTDSEPGRITLAYEKSWPITRAIANAVTVTFTAGWASKDDVPEDLKAAVLLLVGHWFLNREAVNVGNIVNEFPLGFESLILPWKVNDDRILEFV